MRLIDADALSATMAKYIEENRNESDLFLNGCADGAYHYQFAVDHAKTIEERKTGKWFDNADKYDKRAQKHDYFCLECKTHAMDFVGGSEDWWCYKPPKYCPNCGAKMEVDE